MREKQFVQRRIKPYLGRLVSHTGMCLEPLVGLLELLRFGPRGLYLRLMAVKA